MTLNEPWVVADGGYLHGALAPGHRNRFEAPIASHQLMRSHGKAVQAYRAEGRNQIGLVVNIEPKYPASDSPADVAATARAHAYMNRQYLDPALLGSYPEELREIFGEAWPEWPAADMALIRQPIDFVGINYYTRNVTRHDDLALPLRAAPVRQKRATYTETGWEVFPHGLTDTLLWVKQRYGDIAAVRHRERRRLLRSPDRPRPAASTILCAWTTCASTSARRPRRCAAASICAATSPGRCSTTWSGRSATRSASGWSTSTSKARRARPRRARATTRR